MLAADLDSLSKEVPDPKHRAGNFESAEATKLIPLDPKCPDGKTLRINITLDLK